MTFSRERWIEHELWTSPRQRPAPEARPLARRIRVGVDADDCYLAQREPAALVARLNARGHAIELIDVEEATRDPHAASELLSDLDVLVARGHTPAILALLWKAERLGVPVLNQPSAVAFLQDRRSVARVLEEARLTRPLVRARGPVLELCVAGGCVYATRKPPAMDEAAPRGIPADRVALTPDLRALALRVGALLGLDIYGVECVEDEHGLAVTEVTEFPNYSGLYEADERLADLVVARAFAAASLRAEP